MFGLICVQWLNGPWLSLKSFPCQAKHRPWPLLNWEGIFHTQTLYSFCLEDMTANIIRWMTISPHSVLVRYCSKSKTFHENTCCWCWHRACFTGGCRGWRYKVSCWTWHCLWSCMRCRNCGFSWCLNSIKTSLDFRKDGVEIQINSNFGERQRKPFGETCLYSVYTIYLPSTGGNDN